MRYLNFQPAKHLSEALQLLGCGAIIGISVDTSKVTWPEKYRVHQAILFHSPAEEITTIESLQIQLWLGLREMARLRPKGIEVQGEVGDKILFLWKNSTGETDKQNLLNAWMIEWLERCAQSKWKLIPDKIPFDESIKAFGLE